MEFPQRLWSFFLLAVTTAAYIIVAVFGVSALFESHSALAAQSVPYKVNFQGRLTDSSGNALSDGVYNIKFRFYDAATSGTNVWEEDRTYGSPDHRVTVQNGLFNIQFGDYTSLSPSLFNRASTGDLWLEVELPTPATATGTSPVWTELPMTPRQPLASSPYAFNTDTLDGLDSSAFGQLSAIQSWTGTNTFSKSGGAAIVLSGSAGSGGSILQIGSALSGGNGAGTLFGANTTAAGDLINLQVSSALKLKVDNSGAITTAGDLGFTAGADHAITVAQAASGAGKSLTIQAGQSGTGANNGGDLILQAGATGGSGTSGSVKILVNGADTTTAFQVQNAAAAPAFTIDTVANKVVVGDATGTNTGTSLLVVDSATIDPATGYNGAMYYNTTSNVYRCYQAGAWTNCGANITASANSTASFTSGLANVAANSTGVAVETLVFTSATAVSNTAGATGFTAPAAGSFRTCLVKNNAAITAGTLGLRWRVNGVSVGASVCNMDSTVANRRQSSTALDSGVVTFNAGDTIGIAFDTDAAFLPTATNDFTAYWSVEYNASSGNGLTLQFVYDSSTSPAAINLSDSKNLVVNAADTATDPNFLVNLQCLVSCGSGGRFAIQNNGTDAFAVSPNGGGIQLGQATTSSADITTTANLAGSVVNGSTGINTGASGGTQRIDASGNLLNIGSITGTAGTLTLGSDTIQRAAAGLTLDVANAGTSALTVTNSNASFVANLSVEGGVGIGSGQAFSVGATTGSTISACTSNQYLVSAAATGGLVSGGACATADLQNAYANSASPATIALDTSAKDFVVNATDQATDPNILFNLQCATCSASSGRFAIQDNGTDVFTVNPNGSAVFAPTSGQNLTVNLPASSGVSIASAAAPTADQLNIDNTASTGVATAGANGLGVNYKGGAAAVEAAGIRVDFTPGTTSGGTWSGLRIVAGATGTTTGVTEYGLKIEGPTSPGTGTETAAYIGTGWDLGIDVRSGGLQLAAQSEPSVPAANNLRIYAKDIAGRIMPKWVGPAGVDTAFQASLGFNRITWTAPSGGSACGTYSVFGAAAGTTAGTCANPTPASTNLLTSTRRMTYSSGTTAGTVAYQRQAIRPVWRGNAAGLGGFFYTTRFGTSALQTGNRAFIGMSDLAANPTNIDPTTSSTYGKLGMAINASTGNWKFVNNVSGTVPTSTDLGANFPVNTTNLYELVLFSAPNGSSIGYRVTNLSTGNQTSGSVNTNIPANTAFLGPLHWITNNTTAAAAIMDWTGWYLESDN